MRTCIKSSFSYNYGYYASLLFGDDNIYPSISMFIQTCIKVLKEQKIILLIIKSNILFNYFVL